MLEPPSINQRTRELLIGRDALRLAAAGSRLRRLPPALQPTTAITIPGLGGSDTAMEPLRRFLRGLGHDMRRAGLGRQGVDVVGTIPRLVERVRGVCDEVDGSVSLIGWSVGGVMAREVARSYPELVEQVITFGSPIVGGPSYTAFSWLFGKAQREMIEARIAEREKIPIERPVTAIWSPNDGIVATGACYDPITPDVEHVKVTSTHAGMCLDPDVWLAVAQRLDRSPAD